MCDIVVIPACCLQMAREVTQLRSQQTKLRAVCESEMQRAATDAASGIEGLQLRWRQVSAPRLHTPSLRAIFADAVCSHSCLACHQIIREEVPCKGQRRLAAVSHSHGRLAIIICNCHHVRFDALGLQ